MKVFFDIFPFWIVYLIPPCNSRKLFEKFNTFTKFLLLFVHSLYVLKIYLWRIYREVLLRSEISILLFTLKRSLWHVSKTNFQTSKYLWLKKRKKMRNICYINNIIFIEEAMLRKLYTHKKKTENNASWESAFYQSEWVKMNSSWVIFIFSLYCGC